MLKKLKKKKLKFIRNGYRKRYEVDKYPRKEKKKKKKKKEKKKERKRMDKYPRIRVFTEAC
jgi:hypothetical protein